MARKTTFEGGCHCGRVRFRVSADLAWVTECNCSVCSKKGFLHLVVPRKSFELLRGKSALTAYRFNTRVARHLFCKTCGIHSYYVPRSDPDKIDVNVRCLDGVDAAKISRHSFDGRNWEEAMEKGAPWRQGDANGTQRGALVLAYAGCSTCKSALAWLKEHGVPHTVRPIVEEPPSEAELAAWIPASGIGVRKWLNTSGQSYRALGKAKVDEASDGELVRWLARDGKLVKRPVVVWGGSMTKGAGLPLSVTVGFREDAFRAKVAPA